MQIEFKLRVSDFRNAVRQLLVNRGQTKEFDYVDLLVSECVATFRTVGTSVELPIHGLQPGTARLPMAVLEKIGLVAKTFKATETKVFVWDGLIKIGSWQTRNSEIVLGVIPDQSFDMASDASFVDTLALASLLTPGAVKEQGLERRVAKAQRAKDDSIDRATRALDPLMVEREKLAALIDEHIAEARERLRKVLPK